MSEKPRVVFVEVKAWERSFVEERAEAAGWDARFFEEPAESLPDFERSGVEVLSCFIHSQVDCTLLDSCPKLRLVATRSTGVDHINFQDCRSRDVLVANVPHYGENTVAEHTLGLILCLARNIPEAAERVRRGNVALEGLLGSDLSGKTLGVVGAGRIGLHVIRMGRAMNMRVLAYDVMPQPLLGEVMGFEYVDLEQLLREADVVTIHCPLTPATHHLLDAEKLALMKPSALLVNTARGGIVDSKALLEALDEGRLAGAALDVLEGERVITEDSVLLRDDSVPLDELRLAVEAYQLMRHPRVIVTPHVAFYSREALHRILSTTIESIAAFLAGSPQNLVSPDS